MTKIPSSLRKRVKHEPQKTEGLPRSYGDTKIVAIPRDPFWIYAYWEISEKTISKLIKQLSKGVYAKARWIMRVYDITDVEFNGKNANRSFDVLISLSTGSWYVNCQSPNRVWCIDIGVVTPDGKFIAVARSNPVYTPRYGISPITDEKWGLLKEEFERILYLSGVDKIGRSSFDVARLMKEKWEELINLNLPSSGVAASLGRPLKGKMKSFWLKAATELIVYGSTEKDAELKIQGVSVRLKSDGSFSVRMALPDGKINIPIEAVSKDKTMKKSVAILVTRTSKKR